MRYFLSICLLLVTFGIKAQSIHNPWTDISEPNIQLTPTTPRYIIPETYRVVALDLENFKTELQNAPLERTAEASNNPLIVSLPMPNGRFEIFEVVESPVMMQGLAAKFPMIKTFSGRSVSNNQTSVRFDYTLNGFHGLIRTPEDIFTPRVFLI